MAPSLLTRTRTRRRTKRQKMRCDDSELRNLFVPMRIVIYGRHSARVCIPAPTSPHAHTHTTPPCFHSHPFVPCVLAHSPTNIQSFLSPTRPSHPLMAHCCIYHTTPLDSHPPVRTAPHFQVMDTTGSEGSPVQATSNTARTDAPPTPSSILKQVCSPQGGRHCMCRRRSCNSPKHEPHTLT